MEAVMRLFLLAALLALAQPAFSGEKERLVASSLEQRTILIFKASEAAVQKTLPDGWQIAAPAAGPAKGYNLAVVFIDPILVLDAEGKPSPSARGAVLAVPAKKEGMDKSVSMIVGGLSPMAPGPYGVYIKANAELERKAHTNAAGIAKVEENWVFAGDAGDSLELRIQYARGVPARGNLETKNYSAATPDFYRIYRLEQAVDVVRGTAAGTDTVEKLVFKASGERLAPMFDGSEQLIMVISIPWYSRQIFLPGS
jgi:hypothetical protein